MRPCAASLGGMMYMRARPGWSSFVPWLSRIECFPEHSLWSLAAIERCSTRDAGLAWVQALAERLLFTFRIDEVNIYMRQLLSQLE